MTINLVITRMKKENEIWEIYSVFPNTPYAFDSRRQISFALWKARCENSMHDKLNLLDIRYMNDKIIHIYEYNNVQAEHNKQIQIQYNPMLGKKKCSRCYHEIIINNKSYCHKKGKQNTKNRWYKCLYWKEKSMDYMKEKHGALSY